MKTNIMEATVRCCQSTADSATLFYHDDKQEDGIVCGLKLDLEHPINESVSLSLEDAIVLRDALNTTIKANS